MESKITLDSTVLLQEVTKRMEKYNDLSLLEQYGMFMMRCQMLEMHLRHQLEEKAKLTYEETELFTLGTTIRRLERAGLRPDYAYLLRELLVFRNEFAHDFLLDNMLGNEIVGSDFDTLSSKRMVFALYKIHETIIVYDFLNENNLFFIEVGK